MQLSQSACWGFFTPANTYQRSSCRPDKWRRQKGGWVWTRIQETNPHSFFESSCQNEIDENSFPSNGLDILWLYTQALLQSSNALLPTARHAQLYFGSSEETADRFLTGYMARRRITGDINKRGTGVSAQHGGAFESEFQVAQTKAVSFPVASALNIMPVWQLLKP